MVLRANSQLVRSTRDGMCSNRPAPACPEPRIHISRLAAAPEAVFHSTVKPV